MDDGFNFGKNGRSGFVAHTIGCSLLRGITTNRNRMNFQIEIYFLQENYNLRTVRVNNKGD